jgi:sterol desaturase/sphingolipid hydroxylase (fatty acid hydroxylase superfamily)
MAGAALRSILLTSLMFAVVAPMVTLVERLRPEIHVPSHTPWRRRTTDVAYLAVQALAVPALGVLVWSIVAPVAGHELASGFLSRLPWLLQAVGAFVAAELVAYGVHRVEHKVSWLWRLHVLHHVPETLDWLSGFRFHPLDAVAQQSIPVIAVAWLGFSLPAIALWAVIATVVVLYAHANIDVPDTWLSRVIVTPRYHRSHHERSRSGVNYALVLPCVDWLFGTASFDAAERRFGAAANVPTRGFWRQIRWSFLTG